VHDHAGVYGRPPRRGGILTLVLLGLLCACGAEPEGAPSEGSPANGPIPPPSSTAPAADAERVIRPDGIGRATAGITFGELRARLAPDQRLGDRVPFMVDFGALPIISGADTLYHVLVETGEEAADEAPVRLVATVNPSMRTAEGIGPGSTLAEAAAVYGPATLSYNVNDESREYARFAGYDHETVLFRALPASQTSSGVGRYETKGEYNETTSYDPDGFIGIVLVNLSTPR
jgi:hypothetical protein